MWRDKGWYERRGGVTEHHNPNCRCSACVDYETGADEMLKAAIAWLLKYDTYTQYTGRDHDHLVRRLDIPNEDMEEFTGKKY